MTLEANRLASAQTLGFGAGSYDIVVLEGPRPEAFVRVRSVSARITDVPAFLTVLRQDPQSASELLDTLVSQVKKDIDDVFAAAGSGVLYWIEGASPTDFTPMQYGGLFLELDREILESTNLKADTVVFVADPVEAYVDFVSDLPADLFGWDAATGVTPADIRALRPGRLLTDHPEADVRLVGALPARRTK